MTSRGGMRRVAGVLGAALLAIGAGAWAWTRPGDPVARGRSAYNRADWPEAGRLARERLKDAPQDREALRLLARASSRSGSDELAQSLFWRLGSEGAEAEDFFLLASTLARRGQGRQALGLFERARGLDPDHAGTLGALVDLYAAGASPIAAAAVARRLSTRPGWEARGHWSLGRLMLRRRDAAGAAASLVEVLRHGAGPEGTVPGPATVRKLLAHALLRDGRPVEAREALRPVLDAGPDPEASWLLARAWLQEGDAPRAIAESGRATPVDDGPTAEEPAPFIGDARCASCHAAIHRDQAAGRHARTFARAGATADLPLPGRPLADPRLAGVSHTLRRDGDAVRFEARRGDGVDVALLEYVLGSGHRGRTGIVRDDAGRARESRLTHYAGTVGWDLTIHHPERPDGARDLLGKAMAEDQVEDCLGCHVTDVRSTRERSGPVADDRGLRCERCHGPGGNHVKAVALALPDLAIGRARIAGPSGRNALCGDCHRAPAGADTEGRDFVRFQSPNLARSRCFTATGGGLDCTTCHDPHRDAETSPAHYVAACLDCHPPAAKDATPPASAEARPVSCPVNPTDGCVSCHMPSVPDAIPHASYTDHYIRVHRGAPR